MKSRSVNPRFHGKITLMIERAAYTEQIHTALHRSPITALLGPRQCGKTTLARAIAGQQSATFFDLESQPDLQRLQNPELVLGPLEGLVVLDEIQLMPELFQALRVLVDSPQNRARFLILGSASPALVQKTSESLAGRVEFIDLTGFNLLEVGSDSWNELFTRGGFPRSYLADSSQDSMAWREGFIRTFLERDLPQLGITIPATALRRFWTMLAHFHGQTWNASELGRSLALSDKTVRSYLDILSGAFMVRQLQPWFENIRKRQVKAPKIYLRDSGLLHALLSVETFDSLLSYPRVGASWEGFVVEQVIQILRLPEAYFWSTHSGAEVDLFFLKNGQRYGIEIKFGEAPKVTKSMYVALSDLNLAHLWVIHAGPHTYPVEDKITMLSIRDLAQLPTYF